ncbi:MAG: hypothetical protein AAB737_01120 [Patescibacteria group bacterium]
MLKAVIIVAWVVLFALGLYTGHGSAVLPDANVSFGIVGNPRVLLWILAITILAVGATWLGTRLLNVNNKSNRYTIWNGYGSFSPGIQAAHFGYWFILSLCGAIYFLLGSLLGYQAGLYL